MHKRAFTLIEVILTITLIVILAAIAIPRLGGRDFFDRLKLRTATHLIASDIRLARRLAITNSKIYSIRFNFSDNTYDIFDEGGDSIDKDFPKEVPSVVTMSGTPEFSFGRLGDPQPAGGSVNTTTADQRYTVTVESVTGAVIME